MEKKKNLVPATPMSVEDINFLLHHGKAEERLQAAKACIGRKDVPYTILEVGLAMYGEVGVACADACIGRQDIPYDVLQRWWHNKPKQQAESLPYQSAVMNACLDREDVPLELVASAYFYPDRVKIRTKAKKVLRNRILAEGWDVIRKWAISEVQIDMVADMCVGDPESPVDLIMQAFDAASMARPNNRASLLRHALEACAGRDDIPIVLIEKCLGSREGAVVSAAFDVYSTKTRISPKAFVPWLSENHSHELTDPTPKMLRYLAGRKDVITEDVLAGWEAGCGQGTAELKKKAEAIRLIRKGK